MTGTGGFAASGQSVLNRNGESRKQRISGSEYNDAFPTVVRTIAIEDLVQRDFYIDPVRFLGQERTYDLMMPHASENTRWDEIISNTSGGKYCRILSSAYDIKSVHTSLPGFNCSASLKQRMAFTSVAAKLLPPLRPSTISFGIPIKGFTICLDSCTCTKTYRSRDNASWSGFTFTY